MKENEKIVAKPNHKEPNSKVTIPELKEEKGVKIPKFDERPRPDEGRLSPELKEPKSIQEKIQLLIDISANKEELKNLKKIIIEFDEENKIIKKERDEKDERKIKRR